MTPEENTVRWKAIALIGVAAIGAGLVVYGVLTGADWATTVGGVARGLFGAGP